MKLFVRIWIILSVVFICVIILKIFDCQVSLKYEVDEPRIMSDDSESVRFKEGELQDKIRWLWITFSFILVSIFVSIKYLLLITRKV